MNKQKLLEQVHRQALNIANQYKKCEVELIEILEEVDRLKVFYTYGYSSLYSYAFEYLGLSKDVSAIYINVARKTREVPALKEEIKSGNLTVSKARRMTSVLTPANKDHWLELAKKSTKAQLEKEVARANPKEAVRDQMKYVNVAGEIKDRAVIKDLDQVVRVQLQVGVSEQLMIKVRRVQDVLSQKRRRSVGLEEALEAMVNLYLQREDPLEKAKRQKMRGKLQPESSMAGKTSSASAPQVESKAASSVLISREESKGASSDLPPQVESKGASSALLPKDESSELSSASLHQPKAKASSSESFQQDKTHSEVLRKSVPGLAEPRKSKRAHLKSRTQDEVRFIYQGQCAHRNSEGERCSHTRFLEIHHIIPVSRGGSDEVENLVLLCSGHHKYWHLQDLQKGKGEGGALETSE